MTHLVRQQHGGLQRTVLHGLVHGRLRAFHRLLHLQMNAQKKDTVDQSNDEITERRTAPAYHVDRLGRLADHLRQLGVRARDRR